MIRQIHRENNKKKNQKKIRKKKIMLIELNNKIHRVQVLQKKNKQGLIDLEKQVNGEMLKKVTKVKSMMLNRKKKKVKMKQITN